MEVVILTNFLNGGISTVTGFFLVITVRSRLSAPSPIRALTRALFQMASEMNRTFVMFLTATPVMTSSVFIYCYFGNIVTTKYIDVADAAHFLDWYEYPARLQLYVQMIMWYAQTPALISAYTVMRCTLQSFSKVSHSAIKQPR